ncbi:MAG: hypothetical protein JO314_09895 [Acidobacteria bacterium]|nr:hypothetical protein [Acidobacteriota bacterium]
MSKTLATATHVAAYATFAFWLLSLLFLGFTYRTISGEGGRYILEMATISIFGMAILQAVRRRES